MELPVVASDIMGCREAVLDGATGLLVPRADADALGGALKRLIDSPDLRAQLGRAGRRRVEAEFRREHIWEGIVGLYEELLGRQIGQASPEELPQLVGQLEAAKAAAWARLMTKPATGNDTDEQLLTLPAVAELLEVPPDRAYDLARQGMLPVVQIGKYRRVRRSALEAFVAENEQPSVPARGRRGR